MVRRTKEDALATRDSIMDAAEQLFIEQGVSGTSLQHIASAAGVTRGAIYWHFEDKGALFNAMMERATMPLESAMQTLECAVGSDPLGHLRSYALSVFDLTINDPKARRVFEIATLKLEYVGELSAIRERRMQHREQFLASAERIVKEGVAHGRLKDTVKPQAAALGLFILIEGLVRGWLIMPDFNLEQLGAEIVDTHLDSLRA
ncbi:TetR family transcriptional regulator [Massilia violaceinigra]|uniref:TetR family transcriptional regulator n=1 Tax=Massilia violaceinigra TaxID=2045208 RepID=A0A2D2DL48_9BURK|nr:MULTISPECIES: TetR family transcriptional regulator [Massilia]ATQ75704.1 TetR family transcriptional regulator [Massilia violaceinigra]MDQ1924136.1 TetR family transcriptional regulator [Massilia sp. CCM 9206]